MSTLVYFWAPVGVMAWRLWPKLDVLTRRAFWRTLLIFYVLAFGMEYVYLYLKVWTFSEKLDPLLGVRIFNAPIEEFCFWFGATPFGIFVYLGLDRLLRKIDAPTRVHVPRGSPELVLLQ